MLSRLAAATAARKTAPPYCAEPEAWYEPRPESLLSCSRCVQSLTLDQRSAKRLAVRLRKEDESARLRGSVKHCDQILHGLRTPISQKNWFAPEVRQRRESVVPQSY